MNQRDLLIRLLEYIGEQAKDVDAGSYRLSSHTDFLRHRQAVAALPGVEFDIRVEGDHIWMRIQRLRSSAPPTVPKSFRDVIASNSDPDGRLPSIDDAALDRETVAACAGKEERESAATAAATRERVAEALREYVEIWNAWAEGEKPRRKSIELYADLFALKHRLESEETARPQELCWGLGIATWNVDWNGKTVAFEYPIVTQALEIALDENSMALELRPRATEPRAELDCFIACQISAAAETDIAVREQLKRPDRTLTPFDSSRETLNKHRF